MSDINYKLDYLSETKQRIKKAIINKGVEVSNTDTFRSYADKINNISGGSSADIVEAVVDNSALPIESGKKVVVADIQATGQGAGALMPFDIAPYNASGSIRGITRLPDGRVLLNTAKDSNNQTASLICTQVGDRWECEYTTLKPSGTLCLNDKIALLYDLAQSKDNVNYPNPLHWGSSGQYINLKTLTIENISFDEVIPANMNNNYVTRYFLTYDNKYLWGIQMNTAKQITTNSTVEVPLWLYSVNVAEDGTVSATKRTESTVTLTTYSEHIALLSLNHYGICVGTDYGSSSNFYFGINTMYAEYDEGSNVITHNTANAFWNSNKYLPITYTKDWVLVRRTSSPYPANVYKGDWHSAEKISADISAGFTSYPYSDYSRGINRIGNVLFSDFTESYSSSGTMYYLKVPVNKKEPTAEDFVAKSFSLSYEFACFLNEVDFLQTIRYAYTGMPLLRNVNGSTVTYDPSNIPIMLLDDGTGYFYKNSSNTLTTYADVDIIAPVEGSYNNGTILKTIDTGEMSTPFYKMINTTSSGSGQGFRFGPLPMRYINNGDSFVFHNYPEGSSTTTKGFTFFKNVDEEPLGLASFNAHRGVSVSQNKVYLSSYRQTESITDKTVIVCDENGMKSYELTNPELNIQGVFFEFEGETYAYPLLKREEMAGLQGNNYIKITFDDNTSTCQYDILGNSELDYLNQMGQYITSNDMAPSNPYPYTEGNSLYGRPVITKDGKYFVGLAGNHTTHYSKIEKSPSGLPMLNVYEFPDSLKNLLYEQEILYFEAYYPSGFGIQLANGTFLLCEYEQGLDVDLTITTYTPAHSYTFDSNTQCLMHFTSHKHYWYFSAGTYYSAGTPAGYAGCGRREDLPSTYQKKVYSMKHSFAGSDHITGYLTGTYKEDENKNIIAEVKTLLG